ncbi:hypothetical protein V1498_09615 [Peribacillus sp. SCS-26]|uniref:hypothetical protein n=1 Tax=Paraperibacillus marinus TaxID=3115295 RepID=UPI003905DE9D
MQIIATFDHSIHVELVLANLEEMGITRLAAIPLDTCRKEGILGDSLHQSDGVTFLNKGMFLAVIFSVIGASRGFILEWGPVYWGLIGAGGGFLLGFLVDLILQKQKLKGFKTNKKKQSEVVVILECENGAAARIERLLWDNRAMGVALVKEHALDYVH